MSDKPTNAGAGDPLNSFVEGEALEIPMRGLAGEGDDAEAQRMLGRLSAKLFALEAPREQVGRFELEERLGAGAMGVVYAARDPQLDRRVALKLLRVAPGRAQRPDSDLRLVREAQAMARLRHPNVVQVHEVGEHEGQVFVAMELVTGGSLRAWLDEPRDWRSIVEVFVRAGRGLAAAHDAGLVHRDFKPDNVLIEGERVFVGDFGLARGLPGSRGSLAVEGSASESEAEVGLDRTLTQTGACVGTPAYMAPEAFAGAGLDARTDQYAFCCSLFEAVYGERPFDEATLSSLAAAKREGPTKRVAERRRESDAPRWLERVLARGLEPEPSARFASMHELLATLESGLARPRRRRRVGLSLVAVAGAALLGALAVGPEERTSDPGPPLCRAGAERVASVWNDARRARLEAGFAEAERVYSEPLGERVVALIDAHAGRWVEDHRDACEATRVRHEQSERALDLRMRCLDRRLDEFDALIGRLEQPSTQDVVRSVHAFGELTPLSSCSELERLESSTPLPVEAEARAAVLGLRKQLAEVEAAIYVGAYEEVAERSGVLLDEAEALGYRPLVAEAAYLRGMILARIGQGERAGQLLEQAILAAQASGYEELAARAMVGAVHVVGFVNHEIEGGRRYARQAEALLEHLGNPPRSTTALARNIGTLEVAANDLPAAQASFERAVELFVALDGEGSHRVAESRTNLAAVERRLGNAEGALELYALARADLERSLGPSHPSVLTVLNNTAASYIALGRYAEAEASLRETIELATQVHPEGHPSIGHPYNNLGEVLVVQGRHREALAPYSLALDTWMATLGPEHPILAYPLTGRGLAGLELGELEAARSDLERALELREGSKVAPASLGETEFILARTLAKLEPKSARARELVASARTHLDGHDGDLVDFTELEAWRPGL